MPRAPRATPQSCWAAPPTPSAGGARRGASCTAIATSLADRPLWLFSSGPIGDAAADPAWLEPHVVLKAAEELGARDHVVFGGRVPVDPGNFVERAMVRNTPEQTADLRDWDEIRAFARRVAADLRAPVA